MTTPLSERRFRELLDAYGAEIARFPEAERRGAELLLENSETARGWLAEERELDATMAGALSAAIEPLSPDLEQKLGSIPIRHEQKAIRRGGLVRLFVPVVAWAAAACVGLLIGSGVMETGDDTSLGDDESAEVQTDDAALVALALGDEEGFEVWP
jgi:hypothetical protein